MWEVRKARLNARAESRKSGDIRRVARHVGFCMEHKGEKRRIAAETERIGGDLVNYDCRTGAWTFALQKIC